MSKSPTAFLHDPIPLPQRPISVETPWKPGWPGNPAANLPSPSPTVQFQFTSLVPQLCTRPSAVSPPASLPPFQGSAQILETHPSFLPPVNPLTPLPSIPSHVLSASFRCLEACSTQDPQGPHPARAQKHFLLGSSHSLRKRHQGMERPCNKHKSRYLHQFSTSSI